ncbi:hypothetical protein Tcan_02363 [Toxocara canis]|uniref:Solute carrier family 25 member 36-A n=1 Tax=Toxocara canis TaxID=6265 RepID=A0A0B2UJU2_TOXCA|nr:hypothetical protein Tcan_02363 [Toxocara canis]
MDKEAFIHFIGGALGGTAGTAITCPLEVVKTRMQSSDYASMAGGPSTSSESLSKATSKTQSHSRHFSRHHFRRYVPPLLRHPSKLPSGFISPTKLCVIGRVSLHTPNGDAVGFWQRKNIFRLFQ